MKKANGKIISYPFGGVYGWTLDDNNTENGIYYYDGDLCLSGGVLDLNGKTLEIEGDFLHLAGDVNINNGTLIVNGSYYLGNNIEEEFLAMPEAAMSYSHSNLRAINIDNSYYLYNTYSTGNLIMINSSDTVIVNGTFEANSIKDHSDCLTNGTMYIKGDFIQNTLVSDKNFLPSNNHKVVFNGEVFQTIKFDTYNNSGFNDLVINNTNEDGVGFVSGVKVFGELDTISQNYLGFVELCPDATVKNGVSWVNIRINNHHILQSNLTIHGDLEVNANLDLNGKTLEVYGNVTISDSVLKINGGSLICRGDLTTRNDYNNNSCIEMNDTDDYVLVYGDLFWQGKCNYNSLSDGVLELKGDFYQNHHNCSYCNENNFYADSSHTTVFSGSSKQNISFSSPLSKFGKVEIKNTSSEGVEVINTINSDELILTAGRVVLSDGSIVGWTLTGDDEKGDLYIGAGTLDLDHYNLIVNGDLIQSGGTININGGSLTVMGDYRIQKENVNGENVTYSSSTGNLEMTNADGRLVVYGDFITSSVNDQSGKLTNGIMTVKGDFIQNSNNSKNFPASGNHKVILSGDQEQTVTFNSPTQSYFANVEFSNTSTQGVTMTEDDGYGVSVSESVLNSDSIINNNIYLLPGASITGGEITANIRFKNGYSLSDNLIIHGNVITEGDLSLNGNQFVVDNLTVKNSTVHLDEGTLICDGDLDLNSTFSNNCWIEMIHPTDHVVVNGDFTVFCYNNNTMTDGILEIKGDFIQNGYYYYYFYNNNHFYSYYDQNNFMASGSHKTLFSGNTKQTISLESENSCFNIVEIDNNSSEGVEVTNYFNHSQVLLTSGNITLSDGSTVGVTLNNENQDEYTVQDLYLGAGVYDLNGKTLTVTGNLIQSGGTMLINGGTLNVLGDYRIQKRTMNNGNPSYSVSTGNLVMTNADDTVIINGDFVMGSANSHSGKLTNGIMTVKGDFIQNSSNSENFAASGNHKVKLSGDTAQTVTFNSPLTSLFRNVEFANTSSQGITLSTQYSSGVRASGTVKNSNSNIKNYLYLTQSAEIYGGEISANLRFPSGYSLIDNLTINGNVITDGNLLINGNQLEVDDLTVYNSTVSLNGGKLICGGDLDLLNDRNGNCWLEMTHEDDRVVVEGNFTSYNSNSNTMTNGILEIKGDFDQKYKYSSYANEANFTASGNHKTLFSGNSLQTITFESDKSYFNDIEIQNHSTEGVCCTTALRASHVIKNGCVFTYTINGNEMLGQTLEDNLVVSSNLILVEGELDLHGHTLTVNGDFIQGAGTVNINGGTLIVNGNYYMQSVNKDNNGNVTSTGNGLGSLIMTDSNDIVKISGSFVANSIQSHTGSLTDGLIEVGGDFTQITADSASNFNTMGNFTLKLNGSNRQNINIGDPESSRIANIIFDNSSADGIHIGDNGLYVRYDVNDISENVKGKIIVNSLNNFDDDYFSGDVIVNADTVLEQDVTIGGTLYIRSDSTLELNGNTLTANSVYIENGKLDVDGGSLNCIGGFTVGESGMLKMTNAKDRVLVGDWFTTNSNRSHKDLLTNGIIVIRGDFSQSGASDSFLCKGNHRVILNPKTLTSGYTYYQTIVFANPNSSKFNYLVLTIPLEYYKFSTSVSDISNNLEYDLRDDAPPGKVESLMAVARTASTVTLNWSPTKDNVSVIGYELYRNNEWICTLNETSYTDSGLVPETTYNYKIRAFDEIRNLSEYSDVTAVTTLEDNTAPSVPQSLKIQSRTGRSVTLSWLPSSDDVACIGYKIYRNNNYLTSVTGTTTYKDTGIDTVNMYTYKVSAIDAAGNESAASGSISGHAIAPQIISLLPNNNDTIYSNTVTLSARFLNTGNSTGNSVVFEYSSDNGQTWNNVVNYSVGQQGSVGGNLYASVSWDIQALPTGTYWVRATLTDADGETAVEEKQYSINHNNPDQVTNVTAVTDNGVVQLSWGQSGEIMFDGYDIYRSETANSNFEKIASISSQETVYYEDKAVTAGNTYYYYIKVRTIHERESAASSTVSVLVNADAQAPTVGDWSGTATANGSTSVTVPATDNKALDEVKIEYYDTVNSVWVTIGTSTTHTIIWNTTGLADGSYRVRAIATDTAGNQSTAKEKTFVIDNTGPSQVQITSTDSTCTTVSIKWADLSDTDLDYFQVEKKVGNDYVSVGRSKTVLGLNITDLDSDTAYTLRVVGYDTLGNRGTESAEVTVTTKSDTLKPYISDIKPLPTSVKGTINFRITVSDNNYAKKVSLSYSRDNENWTEYQTLTNENRSKSYTFTYNANISGFEDGKIFFRAIAEDNGHNTSEAAVTTYNIDNIAPHTISDLTASDRLGYVELNWSIIDDDIDHFIISRADNSATSLVYTDIKQNCKTKNFYDDTVSFGASYSYKIKAVDVAGNISELSNEAVVQTADDTQAPVIYGFIPGSGSTLSLEPTISVVASDARLATVYFEYYKNGNDPTWIEFGRKENINSKYTRVDAVWDTDGISSGNYTFRAVVIDYNGNISVSDEITYTLDATAPSAPVLNITQGNYTLFLDWNNVQDAEYYKVFRKSELEADYQVIARITGCAFTDTTVLPNLPYSYKIEAYDACGNASISNTASAFALKVDAVDPVAIMPEKITVTQNMDFILDGTESYDNVQIASYEWDTGDEHTLSGARAIYRFTTPGTYNASLTVTDTSGNYDSIEFKIEVLNTNTCGSKKIRVVDQDGKPIKYAYVYMYSDDENAETLKTDSEGYVIVSGDFGDRTVAAYKQGYLPKEQSIYLDSVVDNDTETIVLESGELVVGSFTVHRMELQEMVEAGIDFNDPVNYDSVSFTIDLKFDKQPIPTSIVLIYDGLGNLNSRVVKAPDIDSSTQKYHYPRGDSIQIKKVEVETDPDVPEQDIYAYVHTAEGVSWLKEMFSADLGILNNADPSFTIDDCFALIELPQGLSLASTIGGQTALQSMGSIRGQESKSVSWYIKGDEAGEYTLNALFSGTLMPFGVPVNVNFQTESPLNVRLGEGLNVYIYPESTGYTGEAYYIQYELRNESDRTFYNVETTFGAYTIPGHKDVVTVTDTNGNTTTHVSQGETFYLPEANYCDSVPVLCGGDILKVGILEPGDSIFGTYVTAQEGFSGGADSTKYYYSLVDAAANILGDDRGVQLHVIPIGGHITKSNVAYRTITIDTTWGDPVDITTGAFTDSIGAMALKCDPAINFELNYSSVIDSKGECGYGWSNSYESYLDIDREKIDFYATPSNVITFMDEDSLDRCFIGTESDGVITLAEEDDDGGERSYRAINFGMENFVLTRNTDSTYTLTTPAGLKYDFDSTGRLTKITEANGKYVTITYGQNSKQIREPSSGMYITAYYNENDLLAYVEDQTGRRTTFAYENDLLIRATNALGESISYIYDSNNRIIEEKNNENKSFVKNTYDIYGRVIRQDDGDSATPLTIYSYSTDENGTTTTTITDRNRNNLKYVSDPFGYIISTTDRNGHTTNYEYDKQGNNTAIISAENERTEFTYNGGNMSSIKDASGYVTSMTYDDNGNVTKVTDPDGKVSEYTYDENNQLVTAVSPSNVRKTYTYDSNGHVLTETTSGLGTIYHSYVNGMQSSVSDYKGNITQTEYDSHGEISRTVFADGTSNVYTYDAIGRVLNVRDANGGTSSYTYDCNGNITSITDENGGVVSFEYDENNNLVKEIDKLGNETVHIYDAEGRNIKTVNPDNSYSTTQYDAEGCPLKTVFYDTTGQPMTAANGDAAGYVYTFDKANRLLTETDPNGNTTRHEYYQGATEKKTTYPDGSYVNYYYDKAWRLTKAVDNLGNTYKYEYDTSGNVTKVTDPLDNIVTFEYNEFGQMLSSKDANGNITSYEYDLNGNCVRKTTPDGLVMEMTYDSQNRMLTASAVVDENTRYTVSYQYDALGRLASYTDEEGNVFTTEYDSMGNVTAVSDANGVSFTRTQYDAAGNVIKTTNAANSVTEYSYDNRNNLTGIISNKGEDTQSVTSYTYDAFGRIISVLDAENGVTSATYDNIGNILSITDPNGGTTTYKYDNMNRMTESENAIGSKNTYTYNAQGLLAQSKNARNQSTTYTYDALGRITSATDALGTISYTYDANGNVLTVTDEDDNTATREYDCMNRVTKYTDFRGNVVKYGYDTLGNIVTLEYAGGRIVRYSYFPTGRLKSVVDWNNRTTNYEYDGNGRLTKLSRPDGSVETYQYDAIGQLIEQTDLNGTRVINSFTYTYDTAGHIIQTESTNVAEETVSVTSATMEYDDANRLISFNNETVQYDADGNMTYGPLNGVMTQFTYDCRNRLVSAGDTTYEYDAENNRIAVTVNNVRTDYVVENNASQYSQILSATTNNETTYYIYGSGLISQVDEDGNYLYYHFNNIGSTTVVTGDDGKIVHAFTYGTYGELLSGDTHGILFLYNGRYGVATDSNGLYYMRARYYNPEIKRFINQDVVEGNITNSPSLNKYAYCQGNPVSLLDPFGLSPQINVDWSGLGEAGHGVLSLLGMIPTVGSVFDTINAAWYFSEGNYGEAALSFFGALPGIGDMAVAGVKGLSFCTKGAKIFRLAAKIIGNAGNIALAAPKATEAIIQLWDKHVFKGQAWDDKSLSLAIEGATFGITAVLSAKNLGETIGNTRGELTDIVTSQCFVEGTLIVTNEGDKPIEEIQAGDLVYSTNPETGESEYKEVLRTFRKESDVLIHIFVNGEEIQTTPVHPFWVEDQWVAAKDLEAGDILTLADGSTAPVTYTYGEKLDEPVIVYNFEVADFHTYYVTDTGVLVHNDTCGEYYFRGTSEGYEGNESVKRLGITPTSSDPLVATVFATNGENYGNGILYIASSSDLQGISRSSSNVLAAYEKEVVFDILPKDFAEKASISISSEKARNILGAMGYSIPSRVANGDITPILSTAPSLSSQEILRFVEMLLR